MSSQIRAIFFDAGNTLIFPRVELLAEDLSAQGYPATSEDFYAAERSGKAKLDAWLWPQIRSGQVPRFVDRVYWEAYLKTLVERLAIPEKDREQVMRRVAEGFRDIQLWSRVLPDTPPFLEALSAQSYTLGVISNSVGTIADQLSRVDLARHFDAIIDSAVVGVEKPHPEIFQIAVGRVGVKPSEAVFVGDTYATDLGGAQLAGLHGVLIDRIVAYPQVDCPRITSLPELGNVLRKL